MPALRLLIVDDEPVAARRISRLLGEIEGVAVVGSAGTASEAIALCSELNPDLVLLDIEMPGMTGVELAHRLKAEERAPEVIFVTAYSHFALDAFGLAAVDYLLKPIDPVRLADAINRARSALVARHAAEHIADLEQLIVKLRRAEQQASGSGMEYLWLPTAFGQERVQIGDIVSIAAERDYARIRAGGRTFLVRARISDLERDLAPHGIVRVHRSALVRAAKVAQVEENGARGYRLTLDDGSSVCASRRFAARVRKLFGSGQIITAQVRVVARRRGLREAALRSIEALTTRIKQVT